MKAVVAAFNQEKALVGAFSVITNLRMELFEALLGTLSSHFSPSTQGGFDGRRQQTASPMLTAIMSGGVGISGRELSTQLINSLEQANHSFS